MQGGEDFLIRPVAQGFLLAFPADGAAAVGILAGKEEDERNTGEEGEDDYGSDKSSHGGSPLFHITEKGGEALLIFGFGNGMVQEHGLQHFFLCGEEVFVVPDPGGCGFCFGDDVHGIHPAFV